MLNRVFYGLSNGMCNIRPRVIADELFIFKLRSFNLSSNAQSVWHILEFFYGQTLHLFEFEPKELK